MVLVKHLTVLTLIIVFAFSGFEQPNYVLGEISRPRKRFPLSMIVGTGTVCLLYMATNLAYVSRFVLGHVLQWPKIG